MPKLMNFAERMVCPYCIERECDSDDHIFLQAIAGRRTIPACRACNSLFGSTFEGQAVAAILHPLLIQLAGVGVPVIDPGAKWRRALTRPDGQVYDAIIDEGAYKLESTRPLVHRDERDRKKLDVTVGDDRVGRKYLKQFLNEDKFRVLSIERNLVHLQDSTHNWGFSPAIKLTALKMAFAIATIAFPKELATFTRPREELRAARLDADPKCVQADLRDHPALDGLRTALSHMIYVEQRDKSIQAFVQFFGALQFWVELSSDSSMSYDKATCATLDPVSGIEDLSDIVPLGLNRWDPEGVIDPLLPIKKLNADATIRGAQQQMIWLNTVTLDGVEVEVFRRPYSALSWTGDVPKKKS